AFSALMAPIGSFGQGPTKEIPTVVYKTPTCGCCSKWEKHMADNGFAIESRQMNDVGPIKAQYKVPADGMSCHTAIVQGYVVEGHVPADSVKKLLKERPTGVIGIAVGGMPIGSPGMEGPQPQHYDVLSFDAQGKTKVFDKR